MRLLHQLARSNSAAEALCRVTPSAANPLLIALKQWGLAGSVLSLETIKRAISLESRSRDLLIGALLSGAILPMLLKKLDWKQQDAGTLDEEVGFSTPSFPPSLSAPSFTTS